MFLHFQHYLFFIWAFVVGLVPFFSTGSCSQIASESLWHCQAVPWLFALCTKIQACGELLHGTIYCLRKRSFQSLVWKTWVCFGHGGTLGSHCLFAFSSYLETCSFTLPSTVWNLKSTWLNFWKCACGLLPGEYSWECNSGLQRVGHPMS